MRGDVKRNIDCGRNLTNFELEFLLPEVRYISIVDRKRTSDKTHGRSLGAEGVHVERRLVQLTWTNSGHHDQDQTLEKCP
jgi:hypothetical protein